MPTIRTAIQLYDGTSPGLKMMNTNMKAVISSFQSLQNVSSTSIDTTSIKAGRDELVKTQGTFDDVEKEIREADVAQQMFNKDIMGAQNAAGGLQNKLIEIVASMATLVGLKKVIGLADEMVQITARLNLMNDGLQTTAELQNMIFQSAERSRGSYATTADVVAKLGQRASDAFESNEEVILFAENLNKLFVIAGASQQEVASASLQLTQALGSGVLRGEELNAVFEAAPNVIRTIADYLDVPIGQIRNMAAEGKISASIVKNALLSATGTINEQFESIPMTFAQVMNSVKNRALKSFEPVLAKISEIAQTKQFQQLIDNVTGALAIFASVALNVFNLISSGLSFIADHWSMISPLVWGAVGALIAYNSTAIITKGIMIAQSIAAGIKSVAMGVDAAATTMATIAQQGLNAALAACPLNWIIMLVIALIAIFYAAVAAVNHFAGTSVSATGIIVGAFMAAIAFIGNLFISVANLSIDIIAVIWNAIATFAEFIANVFVDPLGSVVRLFAGMADTVLGILETIARVIDTIFGSELAKTVSGWRTGLEDIVVDLVGKAKIEIPRADTSKLHLERFEYGEAWNVGYKIGETFEENFDINKLLGGAFGELDAYDFATNLEDIYNDIANTAENTAKMANAMEASEEDLRYLRDLAEQEVINRFTTAEIKVDLGGVVNQVDKDVDLDGMVEYLEEKLYETMRVAAEGVHE